MSLTNGLEYIHTTKQSIKSRLQGKGVDVSDNSPFRHYPDLIESALKNKSWQYPSDWFALTPKAEFPDHTMEMIAYDADYDFKFVINCTGVTTITVYGSSTGGTYTFRGSTYNLNQTYEIPKTGGNTVHFTRGTGKPSKNPNMTTFKIVITATEGIRSFYPTYIDTSHITYLPILAVRVKDSATFTKNFKFGDTNVTSSGSILYYRGEFRHMQYCDLSMVRNLYANDYMFNNCPQLVRCELPNAFEATNYMFQNATSLREVTGLDFNNIYEREGVFSGCRSFTPPSFNYWGKHCYNYTNISGKVIQLPDGLDVLHPYFISNAEFPYNYEGGDIGGITTIKIPDTCSNFYLRCLRGNIDATMAIILPSNISTIVDEPEWSGINSVDSLFYNPYRIENGENFTLDTPVGVTINAYYGDSEVYLPHVPLRFFSASCSLPKGSLKKITFDWDRTDLSNSGTGSTSTYFINIAGHLFEHDTLVELFNNVPVVPEGKTFAINVKNNPGASSLTDEEIAIVTDKGYVLTK